MSIKNRANAVWCIANTPVCAGSGEGDFRADCNIQRSDDFPKIDAGTFKGSLLYKMDDKLKKIIQNKSPEQAKLSFSDLRLLFFSVQSSHGIYRLLTSVNCLEQFFLEISWNEYECDDVYQELKGLKRRVVDGVICQWSHHDDTEWVGGYKLQVVNYEDNVIKNLLRKLGLSQTMIKHIGIVTDKDFKYFTRYHTEIITRNRLENQALFTEEYLPEGSVLYGFICEFKDLVRPVKAPVLPQISRWIETNEKEGKVYQIGRNLNTGKGSVTISEMKREEVKNGKPLCRSKSS